MISSVGGVNGTGQVHAVSQASGKRPMNAIINDIWNQADPSGAGSVSRSSFAAGMSNADAPGLFANLSPNELFDRIDTDKDGTISREQFRDELKNVLADLKARRSGTFADILSNAESQTAPLSAATQSLNATMNRKGSATDALVDLYA